jgi:hypothetical protein
MKLQAVFCLLALSTSMVNLFSSPAWAGSKQAEVSCETAITNAKERIVKGRNLTVVKVNTRDNSKNYSYPLASRPLIMSIYLSGRATASVMNSPVLQKAISSDIIKSCPSVGAVAFLMAQTDWVSLVGLMPDGTIQKFECISPDGEGGKPAWGKYYCF